MNTQTSQNTSSDFLPRWRMEYDHIGDPRIQMNMKEDLKAAEEFNKKYKDRVNRLNARELLAAVQEREALTARAASPLLYATMMYHGHMNDPGIAAFYEEIQNLAHTVNSHLLFWDEALQKLNGDKLEAMCAEEPGLTHYRPYFAQVRMLTPHTLSEEQEKALTSSGSETQEPGLVTQRSLLESRYGKISAQLTFPYRGDTLSLAQIRVLRESSDETVRRDAHKAIHETFAKLAQKEGDTPASLMNQLIDGYTKEDTLRGYLHPDSAALLANHLERNVVDTLRSVVKEHYSLNQRYLRAKAKLLGKDMLEPWDVMAPTTKTSDKKIPWEEAKETVLQAFHAFSPDMEKIARQAFDEHWIDAEIRDGKYPGAFCCDPSDGLRAGGHPYVSLNYQGRPSDVITLAHELGHAIHHVLVANKHGDLMDSIPTAFAETASLFAETLVMKGLMTKAKTDEEKLELLDQKITRLTGAIMLQISYDEFEQKIRTESKYGALRAESYARLWKECQNERLGDAVKDDPQDKGHSWAAVPHFFVNPFYVHSYAFADLLVASLFKQFEEEKAAGKDNEFMEKYMQMLTAGGTEHHSVALKERFGDKFDLSSPKFWEGGIQVFADYVSEFEKLVDQQRKSAPNTKVTGSTPTHVGTAAKDNAAVRRAG